MRHEVQVYTLTQTRKEGWRSFRKTGYTISCSWSRIFRDLTAEVTVDSTYDIRDDPRRVLYVLLAGAQDGGPTARAAQQAQDEKLAEFFSKVQEEVVEVARERLAKRESEIEKETLQQQAYAGMLQVEEFAERAAQRLESMADRLVEESRKLGVDGKTLARAQELRVAAFIVREEAELMMARKAAPYGSQGGRHLLPATEEPDKVRLRAR